ncbi:hypothetical protein [Rothia mucilaginosa]|jgi:hypothetical protein
MITLFENLFNGAKIQFIDDEKGNFSIGEPPTKDSSGYSLRIVELPKGSYLIGIDDNFKVGSIFGSCHSQSKRPDYLIVDPNKSVACVLELKSSLTWKDLDKPDIISQLKGGQAFLEYCEALIKIFISGKDDNSCSSPCSWCKGEHKSHKYKIRYVCIYGLNSDKSVGARMRRVTPPRRGPVSSRSIAENSPDNFIKIGRDDIYINGDTRQMEIYWNKILCASNFYKLGD